MRQIYGVENSVVAGSIQANSLKVIGILLVKDLGIK